VWLVLAAGLVYMGTNVTTPRKVFASARDRSAFFESISSPETRVVALVASWCGACRGLEANLKDAGIQYTRVDIDESPEGRRLFDKTVEITGKPSIPKVVVDDMLIDRGVTGIKEALGSSGQKS